jgi:DNA ligase-1
MKQTLDPKPMRAYDYEAGNQVENWYMSEKLDGVWARWNGHELLTREGTKINAHELFLDKYPGHQIEGELWSGRSDFKTAVSTIKKLKPVDSEWKRIKFCLFDMPIKNEPFHIRHNRLKYICAPTIHIIDQLNVKSDILDTSFKTILHFGGEGLVFKNPHGLYKEGKSHDFLRMKLVSSDEASVIGYEQGEGKFADGIAGTILVSWKDKTFSIALPITELRKNPPAIGSKITFNYRGLTSGDKPRQPTFVIERDYE